MAPSIVDTLPPELLAMVAALAEPEDHLSLKLTCKTFAQLLPETVATALTKRYVHDAAGGQRADMTRTDYSQTGVRISSIKARTIMILARSEFDAIATGDPPKLKRSYSTKALAHLLCTKCGNLKSRASFRDTQASKSILRNPRSSEELLRKLDLPLLYRRSHRNPERICTSCLPPSSRTIKVGGLYCLVCTSCGVAYPPAGMVITREGNRRDCKACLDEQGIGYTIAKNGDGFVVYDPLIDIEQLLRDHEAGKV